MNEETDEREALLYMKLNSSDHIVHTFGFVKNNLRSIVLLQERAPHGDLKTLLRTDQYHPTPQVLQVIFLQTVNALLYMSGKDIVHGDVRPANVLVFERHPTDPAKSRVKLTNFRLARSKADILGKIRLPDGPVRYLAPEIILAGDGSKYSDLSDVYSLGVLMWQVCSNGKVPYGSRTSDEDVRRQVLSSEKLQRPKQCPAKLWSIIEGCLFSTPEIRMDLGQVQTGLANMSIR
jgi:serine/threonine protein kinase